MSNTASQTFSNLTEQIKGYDAVCLFSGGTDSTVTAFKTKERVNGGKVLLLTLDTGIGEEEIKKSVERAKLIGFDHLMYDGIDEFCNVYIASAIQMNADYQGFPLGTPLARAMAFDIAVRALQGEGDKLLSLGSTRCQNTRLRAIRVLNHVPNIKVYAPLADQVLSRGEKVELLKDYDIPVGIADNFSTDENLWSRCTESHEINKINLTEMDPRWFQLTVDLHEAVDTPEMIELTFQDGLPVAVNGEPLKLSDVIRRLNDIGRVHALGRIVNVEDTAFGDKIRSIYEAPGAEIILKAHSFIESIVMNKYERDRKAILDKRWGEMMYHGDWNSPERLQIESEVMPWQMKVTGTLKIELYKGNIRILDGHVPDSLLLKKEVGGLY